MTEISERYVWIKVAGNSTSLMGGRSRKKGDTYSLRVSERLEFLFGHFYPGHKTDRVYSLSCIEGKDSKRLVAGAKPYSGRKKKVKKHR